MAYQFTLSTVLPATPEAIYRAWLDTRLHSAMTRGTAVMSSELGARVTAWDGYISGSNVELVPGERIVQTWRTTKFSAADPDSTVTVQLERTGKGTRLTLIHANVPDGHTGYEQGGWQQYYFEPMRRYFSRLAHLRAASGKAKSHQAKKSPARESKAARKSATKHRTVKGPSKKGASNKRPAHKRSRRS